VANDVFRRAAFGIKHPLKLGCHAIVLDLIDEEDIEEGWHKTLVDSPYRGPIREAIKSLAAEVTRV